MTEKCRLCLSDALEIQSIFDSQLYQSVPLALKIAVCISLPITQEDPFSKLICKKCRMFIDQFYSFRESCMSNYIHLLGVECSRVTELEELMTISYDINIKPEQPRNNGKISPVEPSKGLDCGSRVNTNLNPENNHNNIAASETHLKNVKTNSSFVLQDDSNLGEDDASCENRKLTEKSTDYQNSKIVKELRVNGGIKEETETVKNANRESLQGDSGNIYTEIGYSELEENVEPNSPYRPTTIEEVLEAKRKSNEEVEESTIYYSQIDVREEQLEEYEPEVLVEQGLHFRCNNCLKVFLTSSALNEHYEEGQCHSVTVEVVQEELSNLNEGLLEVDGITEGIIQTEYETGQSIREGRARWGEKRKYPCETCRKMFNTRTGLLNHVRIHTGERPFLCSLCTRSFSQKGALLNHERKHRGEWPYPCQQCGKGFFRPSDLEKHVRSHTDERPFLCSICSKSFHQMSGLTVHERIHSGERPYSCSICKMTFTQLSNKYRHMKTHADGKKPYACDICHRKFADKNELHLHRAVHEGAKPRICHYCNKGFRKPYELRDHLRRSHTNERPYTCQLCNKSFFVAHDLKNHLYIHTGERPFSCAICSQTFTQSGNLKRHHLRHHPGFPLTQISTKPSPFLLMQQVKVETVQVQNFEADD